MATVCLFLLFILPAIAQISEVQNASVTWNSQTGAFEVHSYFTDNAVAYATFKDEIFLTGWSYLEVKTDENYPDNVQAYAAGLSEGYLTRDLVKKHWNNLARDYCKGEDAYCQRLDSFLQKNLNFVISNVQSRRKYDTYWHQVALTLEQLSGLEDGFHNITGQPDLHVNVMGLMLLNIMGDLIDLEKALKRSVLTHLNGSGSCSGLVRVLPNNKDIYFSHDTWTSYKSMLRVLKKYSLKYHTAMNQGSPVIPGHTSTFSSYPGYLYSMDDFYLHSSGLAVMETTIPNYNTSLYQYVTPESTILEWQRTIIANRLAKNGKQWISLFSIMNSGTYNNQWMVLDYKRFKTGKPLQDELFWVLEQLPGYIRAEDATNVLRNQSFWPSYNVAYFKDVFNLSGAQEKVKQYGDFFTYSKTARARIFKRDHGKVHDIPSMIRLMRYNDFTKDPFSKCKCSPPYSADMAISARNDLNSPNGTYPFDALGQYAEGGTDMKLTTFLLFTNLEFVAIGGPTYDPLPPFQWSKSDFEKTVPHEGHPDLWNFKPIVHRWM